MGQIICFYVNTHVLKSGAGHLVTLKQGYKYIPSKYNQLFPTAQTLKCTLESEAIKEHTLNHSLLLRPSY